jgi:hypothetical protein
VRGEVRNFWLLLFLSRHQTTPKLPSRQSVIATLYPEKSTFDKRAPRKRLLRFPLTYGTISPNSIVLIGAWRSADAPTCTKSQRRVRGE